MQRSTILIGLLVTGLAIALVTTIGSFATFAENQSSNNIYQSRANVPIMQGNTGTGMMEGTNMMPGMPEDTNQQQQMMKGNMGSMMGMMNSTMSMQDMMGNMMGPNYVHAKR